MRDVAVREKAFSLFEVMIAMAICVAGLVLILQMLGTSEALSRRAEVHLQCQQACRSLLNCYLAGIVEPVETQREELLANPDFWYSVKLEKHGLLPLESIAVEVWPKSPRERDATSRDGKVASSDRDLNQATRFRLVGYRARHSGMELKPESLTPGNETKVDGNVPFSPSPTGMREGR